MTEPAWMALADGIWEWGLVPLRAHKTESKNNPDKPGILVTRHCKGLVGAELIDYRRVCTTIHEHAVQAGIDLGELVLDIARAMERGAHKAAAANAKRVGRLTPEQRRQYRRNSAAARGLAQWLSKEIRERPIPTGPSDGVITYTFTEGSDRNPTALADILIQRRFVKVDATEAGATVHCEGGPNSVAPAMQMRSMVFIGSQICSEQMLTARDRKARLLPNGSQQRLSCEVSSKRSSVSRC